MNKLDKIYKLSYDYYNNTILLNKLKNISGNNEGIALLEYKINKLDEEIKQILNDD